MRTGVLIAGYGGPDSLEAVGPFMCNLMRREPSEDLVERVCRKYLAIGGASPLPEIAGEIAGALQQALSEKGHPLPVVVGMRYWEPYIESAMEMLRSAGCERVLLVSMSPFESRVATESYREAVARAAEGTGMVIEETPLVGSLSCFDEYYAAAIASALVDLGEVPDHVLVFTAHSLPEAEVAQDDAYVAGLRRVADAVATRLALPFGREGAGAKRFANLRTWGSEAGDRDWYLVYQSKGERGDAWLGPEIEELIDACAEAGVPGMVVCPIGFLTEHMETLYDLDIVAAGRAFEADMDFVRVPAPNDYPSVIDGLADEVIALLDKE